MSNFDFLQNEWPLLAKYVTMAEQYLYTDSNACLYKLGSFAEQIVSYMFDVNDLCLDDTEATTANKIKKLHVNNLIPNNIDNILYSLRKTRNKAVHDGYESIDDCKTLLKMAYRLAIWFQNCYGEKCESVEFVLPDSTACNAEKIQKQEAQIEELKAKLSNITKPKMDMSLMRVKSEDFARRLNLSEEETRYIIDKQLRLMGWEVDSKATTYASGARPSKGKNLIISEFPTNSNYQNRGYADYAFFIGTKLVAICDAKKPTEDLPGVLAVQCKDYAKNIRQEDFEYCIDIDCAYNVPFIFATNGRVYNDLIKEKSGIWFQDLRQSTNIPYALTNWFSPQDIQEKLELNINQANEKIINDNDDYLTNPVGLNLRKYQLKAIEKVSQAVVDGKKEILVAMATGTGKTRTLLGLIYKLLESKRFNRTLFLVDRVTLGEQAMDTFKDVLLEQGLPLTDIFQVNDLENNELDKDTKLSVCTVQSLVSKVVINDEPSISPGAFDLIVIDEAHRGYILDKEMSEEEQVYLNQNDFVSKYRKVIEYFDATKIALTATPAKHTTEIFGEPIYSYSYREAVIDGYLVDFEPPHNINTVFTNEGVVIEKGEQVAIYDAERGELLNGASLDDEVSFEVESFNRQIILKDTTNKILQELVKYIDPTSKEKTLIFAVNDAHADRIVTTLKELYNGQGVDDDAIMKITGKTASGAKKKIAGVIKQFKNDDFPNIAVTVDLLSTGVDVPRICNIVFMRKIKSRILYEQMLGRATRLCPEIGKTHFNIFDAVRLYDSLKDFSNMNPVVANINKSMEDLVTELTVENHDHAEVVIEKIVAKLQRKNKGLSDEQKLDIEEKYGVDIKEYITELRNGSTEITKQKCIDDFDLLKYIEGLKNNAKKGFIISNKQDTLLETTRGYGKNVSKPEDYIDSFIKYINNNKDNFEAIKIACTKPSTLTKEMLKELNLKLGNEDFTMTSLNSAYSEMTNQEIIADIITYVRKAVLNTPIYNHEERVHSAVAKLIDNNSFNKMQINVIKNIETYMLHESVINEQVFDSGEFKRTGGYNIYNRKFDGKLQQIILELNTYLFESKGVA